MTKDKALAACGYCRHNQLIGVGLVRKKRGEDEVTAWENLQSCGKVWICPVCSAKVRASRACEIATAGVQQLERGGALLTMAHTFPHDATMGLAESWKVLSAGLRSMSSGKASQKDRERFGIEGHIRAHEVTIGANGWHPHGHTLFVLREPLPASAQDELQDRLYRRFARKVERLGYGRPLPTYNRLEAVEDMGAFANYVSKVASEVARFDTKQGRGGRTPFQVLEDFSRTGDTEDLEIWWEWEKGSRGKSSIRWSPGLKGRYSLDDRTDEDLAAEEVEGVELDRFDFSGDLWKRLRKIPEAQSLMMTAIERGGAEGVLRALVTLLGEAEACRLL